jgi:hypothetical protein
VYSTGLAGFDRGSVRAVVEGEKQRVFGGGVHGSR